MMADIFTKALPGPAFTKHNLGLGLTDESIVILSRAGNQNRDSYNEEQEVSPSEGRNCESLELTPVAWSPDFIPS